MTTPITDHDPGDESNHQDVPTTPEYREIVGLHGIEAVVPSSGKWMKNQPPWSTPQEFRREMAAMSQLLNQCPNDPNETPRQEKPFPDKQRQIHKEGAD